MVQIFKKEDKVFDIRRGWGIVCKIDIEFVEVEFKDKKGNNLVVWYQNDYSLSFLSFTEYTLEGFSQERPEPLPKLGDIVWGKSFNTTDWSIGHYLGKQHASYKISSTPNALSYWLAYKITTTNPYENN
jgi:hypothetical protein